MYTLADFFDLEANNNPYPEVLENTTHIWDPLARVAPFIEKRLTTLQPETQDRSNIPHNSYIGPQVYIGEGTIIQPNVTILGPAIIGKNCEIRAGAYFRENILVGDGVVVGHSTELKNCILFNEVEVPHFNYVGDSILGWRAHLGAGVKISNFKINHTPVSIIEKNGRRVQTGRRKFGAIIGDEVEIGCNAILNPGTLIGPRTLVAPGVSLQGSYDGNIIVKLRQKTQVFVRRD